MERAVGSAASRTNAGSAWLKVLRSGIPLAFGCLLTLTPALGFAYFAPLRPNFPVTLPGGGVTAYSLPLVVDIDNDGKKEIVVGTSGTATAGGKLFVLNSNGQIRWSVTLPANINSSPAAGNLLGLPDGSLQIVIGCGSPVLTDHRPGGVYVYRADGTFVWRFLTRTTIGILANGVWSTPALGDLDGDGQDEEEERETDLRAPVVQRVEEQLYPLAAPALAAHGCDVEILPEARLERLVDAFVGAEIEIAEGGSAGGDQVVDAHWRPVRRRGLTRIVRMSASRLKPT